MANYHERNLQEFPLYYRATAMGGSKIHYPGHASAPMRVTWLATRFNSEDWTYLRIPATAETEERIEIGPRRHHARAIGDLLHPESQWYLARA